MNVKEWQRPVLLVAMAVVGVLLLIEWQKFQATRQPAVDTITTSSITPSEPADSQNATNPVPAAIDRSDETAADEVAPITVIEETNQENTADHQTKAASSAKLLTVTTDTLEVVIDTYGGDIVKVALLQHSLSLEQPDQPFILLNRTNSLRYIAQTGLLGSSFGAADTTKTTPLLFTADSNSYVLNNNDDSLVVDLKHNINNNVALTKRYTFGRNRYLIDIDLIVENRGQTNISSKMYSQMIRDNTLPVKTGPGIGIKSFFGPATTTDEDRYDKYKFDDIKDGDFSKKYSASFHHMGGWMAMVQHYFVSAVVPPAEQENDFFIRPTNSSATQFVMGYVGPSIDIPAGQTVTLSTRFYSGPKDIHRLEEIAPHLDRVLDFSWLFFIARPMYLFLLWIHDFVKNWGLAIILLVLCIKALFYPIASAGFRSMAKMKVFAPKMQELKERYSDNKQKFSEEMMKLYKKEGVNPVGGCLPVILQIPVFISLYWVILEAVDLRHAPFMLWINDLSDQDPFFILPLLYGVIMWFQQKLNPAMGDPTQQKIMQMMPIVFTFMFLFFPAGLVLYWVVNQLLSILQQWYITKQIERSQGLKKA